MALDRCGRKHFNGEQQRRTSWQVGEARSGKRRGDEPAGDRIGAGRQKVLQEHQLVLGFRRLGETDGRLGSQREKELMVRRYSSFAEIPRMFARRQGAKAKLQK